MRGWQEESQCVCCCYIPNCWRCSTFQLDLLVVDVVVDVVVVVVVVVDVVVFIVVAVVAV